MKRSTIRRLVILTAIVGGFTFGAFALWGQHARSEAQAGQPDLTIEPTNVWISPQRPVGGDTVTLKAAIVNVGDTDVVGVSVAFSDNADGAVPVPVAIGSTTVDVPAGAVSIAEVAWNTSGQHADNQITATVDPANLITEGNESNNQATATIFVSTVVGNVNCLGGVNVVDALAILRWVARLDFNHLIPCPLVGQ